MGTNSSGQDIIRIANCSGFYGDKLSAAREMVEGGPIDVLTGDYLAELTMAILHAQKEKNPDAGYVGTFLKQVRDVLGTCLEKNIKIVSNAGGLNPKGMAKAVEAIANELGLNAKIAYIDGDDLLPRLGELGAAGEEFQNIDTGKALCNADGQPVTANAYLGAWGIKRALDDGADVVICPRVTDAAVIIGPAAWKFNWQRSDFDALAGALAAGHIIECGVQATGGNYAFFQDVPSFTNMGFPIAEIEADGSFTITKHPGTGGLVSEGTLKAQLLYEISSPAYLNPDVTAHFDTLKIEQSGVDRVRVSGCRGSSPPPGHKVCLNIQGWFRNSMEIILSGLDVDEKAKLVADTLFASVGGRDQFGEVHEQIIHSGKADPATNEESFSYLRITVKSHDQKLVGRIFSAKVVELVLANIPGFATRAMPGDATPYVVHWPALVDSKYISEKVHFAGNTVEIQPTSQIGLDEMFYQKPAVTIPEAPRGETVRIAFGRLFGTRSGDKGGCANIGVWARSDAAYGFLHEFLSVEKLKELMADAAGYEIERYELPNINALNFNIRGILGDGVSSSTRIDGQGKTLGEYLRAKMIDAPKVLID